MAVLISAASGNFTSLLTVWDVIETGTGASQTTRSSSTNTTTSYVYSSAFTGTNLNICDGLLLYCDRLTNTGTVSVTLSEDNGTTATREVTVNATDLHLQPSWTFFKFGSSLTLDGGTDYKVGIKGSSAGNAAFYRDGTAGNWARRLRLVSLATAAAGDTFYIVGEHTGAAATTAITITMDETATTDYGTGTDGSVDNGIDIGDSGTLQYGTAAATNYYLKLSGSLAIHGGGIFNMGTVATPIPRGSTAVLEFDPVADSGMGIRHNDGGTITIQGLSRTSGKDIFSAKLNTDEAAAQTTLGVDTDTGWLDTDEVVIATTTRTASESEKRTLSGNAGASSFDITAGLTNAHSGTSPAQAEVILLTRNVKIRSATSTIMASVGVGSQAIAMNINIDWAEFRYVERWTVNFDENIQYCSWYDCEDFAINLGTNNNGATVSNNVFYNINSSGTQTSAIAFTASNSNSTFSGNIIITAGTAAGDDGISMDEVGHTFTNNTVVGAGGVGILLSGADTLGTFSGNTAHSCGEDGFEIDTAPAASMTFTSTSSWRNNNAGIVTSASLVDVTYATLTLFGNVTYNLEFTASQFRYTINTLTSGADTTFATTNGIGLSASAGLSGFVFNSADFSTVSGILAAHTTDINLTNLNTSVNASILLKNSKLGAATEVGTQTNLRNFSDRISGFVKSAKHDQTAGTHKSWFQYGTITTDTGIADAGTSQRLKPNSASDKLESGSKKVAVANTGTVTVTVKVRESVVGDGTDYNGNRIRLIVKRNDAAGITADAVLATATVASEGAFETLNGTTAAVTDDAVLEFVVDCDGTTGWINIDTWTTS